MWDFVARSSTDRGRIPGGPRALIALALSALASVAILAWVVAPPAAWGWANGANRGDGYGTHDWVLDQGLSIAQGRGGGAWVDRATALAATDDPDTRLHDFVNHVYQTTGHVYGSAPRRVQALSDRAIAQLRGGDRVGASVTLGLLAHYYGDVCNPLHTDQTPGEKKIHSRYETRVNSDTDEPGENTAWVIPLSESPTTDESARTIAAAAHAHLSYTELVEDYSANGYDARVRAITTESLSSAANGVAAIIDDIGRQAGVQVAAAPAAGAQTASASATVTSSALDTTSAASGQARGPTTSAGPAASAPVGASAVWCVLLLFGVTTAAGVVVLVRSRSG